MELYHASNHSYIDDTGTGNLYIQSNHVNIDGGGQEMANFIQGGAVELYHSNNERFRTTSTGTYTTGIATASGVINSLTDVQINGVSVTESALNDAVAMAIALG